LTNLKIKLEWYLLYILKTQIIMKKAIQILQIVLTLWVLYIFLGSLPFKFTGHEHTQFIFGTI